MTTEEAYTETMNTIQQIELAGVKIEISPRQLELEKEMQDDPTDFGLSTDLWKLIEFYPATKLQQELIYHHTLKLAELGILFDTARGPGVIEWCIDWSFRFEKNSTEIENSIRQKEFVNSIANEHFAISH